MIIKGYPKIFFSLIFQYNFDKKVVTIKSEMKIVSIYLNKPLKYKQSNQKKKKKESKT